MLTLWERFWDELRHALRLAACFVVIAVVIGWFVVVLTLPYWFPDWQPWRDVPVLVGVIVAARVAAYLLE